MSDINIGDRLFHYNPNSKKITGCTVVTVDDKYIVIDADEEINKETRKIFQLKALGKWLFLQENHIELPFDKLTEIEEYYKFKNSNIESVLSETIKIKKFLESRQINNLVHFTRLGNLRSILQHGLVPRSNQDYFNIKSVCNDVERFDYRLDATSCSITFPNDRIFRSFRDNKYPNEKWVVLILDAKVILSTENVCEFFLTNAANKIMRSQSGFELRHFQNMFNNEITIQKSDGSSYTCIRQQMPDNFTTDVQAEILIRGKIEKYYIKKVVFDVVETKNEWYANNSDIANDFCLDIMPEYFGWRTNFRG